MTMTPELDIHDMIRELTANHPHRQAYLQDRDGKENAWSTQHFTTVPALIMQLLQVASQNGSEEAHGATPRSKPAVRVEAVDTVMLIDSEAGDWIHRLRHNIPGDQLNPHTMRPIVGSGTIRRLLRLNGLYPATDTCGRQKHPRPKRGKKTGDTWHAGNPWCCTRGHLEHDVQRWWSQARIISGWDIPPFRPRATCPVCEASGSLRVKLDGASCVECQSLWGPGEVGLLAEHIRQESEAEPAA